MRGQFRITFYVWPYSGITREPASFQSEDEQKTRGAREPAITLSANSFHHAVEQAQAVIMGIRLDERVWECGIQSCEYMGER